MCVPCYFYLFIWSCTTWLLLHFGNWEEYCYKHGNIYIFNISLSCLLGICQVAGLLSHTASLFFFYCYALFHSGCNIYIFNNSMCPFLHITASICYSVFWMLVVLEGEVVFPDGFRSISLVINDIEHCSIYPLAISICFQWNCLFWSFAHC